MSSSSLFSDFLTQLGVPHTADYSDQQCADMPFQTLFGLSKLLDTYQIPNEALQISDKAELAVLTPPFIADTPDGLVIVTEITKDNVNYLSQGEKETIDTDDFKNAWNGIVLLAFPTEKSIEPGYEGHHIVEFINSFKKWIMWAGFACLFTYIFLINGIYKQWSTIYLTAFNIIGLILTFMLMQKTLKIKNKAADEVCGVLEEGGCDSILQLKASSFFGIFKWSEVGLAYFSISLPTLLIFPQFTGYLALFNACCLPFTIWSIWYQKFRAKKWCTLCVSVQATLWFLFIGYLLGGWYHHAFPIRIEFFILAITYVTVLLAINAVSPDMKNRTSNEANSPS